MTVSASIEPTLAAALAKLARVDELVDKASALREKADELFRQCYGLESGITRVHQGDLEGIFLSVIRFKRDEGRLWIYVKLDPPLPEKWATHRKSYADWEKVPDR